MEGGQDTQGHGLSAAPGAQSSGVQSSGARPHRWVRRGALPAGVLVLVWGAALGPSEVSADASEAAAATTAAVARWGGAAVVAPAAGALAATLALATREAREPAALVRGGAVRRIAQVLALPLLVWALGVVAGGRVLGALPAAPGAACALAALVALGACAVTIPRPAGLATGLARAALLVPLAYVMDGAAAGWEVLGPAPVWSTEWSARLLDLSPRAFVLEHGGIDWMRHPSVYEAVGTDRIGPGIRVGWGRSVAALVLIVVGCGAAGGGSVRSPRP